jgi:hypothetical protein
MTGLPAGFSRRAFEHIMNVVRLGSRAAGTTGEAKAVEYVRKQFHDLGLYTEVEPFEYASFRFTDVDLQIAGRQIASTLVAFDPYGGPREFAGNATLYDPPCYPNPRQPTAIDGRIVVTTDPADYFQVALQGPKLVVYVEPADYALLRDSPGADFSLRVQGQLTTHSSANVIGQIAPATGAHREIILSAHLDAYPGSPGADDNASGLGVLIELARWFAARHDEVSCQLRFIAFGAEELAILGSRVYVERHAQSLQHCALALNLDQIGGNAPPFIEMLGGVKGVQSEVGQSQFPARFRNRALDGQGNAWRMIVTPDLLAPMAASNRPDWLVTIIRQAVQELKVEIEPVGNTGSDQQAFTQAGVVATGIGVGGNEAHTPRDTPDQIHLPSLQIVGEIVAWVTTKTMQRVGGAR